MPVELLERARKNILESQRQEPKQSPEEAKEIRNMLDFLRTDCEQLLEQNGILKGLPGFRSCDLIHSIETNGLPVRVRIRSMGKQPKESYSTDISIQGMDEYLEMSRYGNNIIINRKHWTWRKVTEEDARSYREVVDLVKQLSTSSQTQA